MTLHEQLDHIEKMLAILIERLCPPEAPRREIRRSLDALIAEAPASPEESVAYRVEHLEAKLAAAHRHFNSIVIGLTGKVHGTAGRVDALFGTVNAALSRLEALKELPEDIAKLSKRLDALSVNLSDRLLNVEERLTRHGL